MIKLNFPKTLRLLTSDSFNYVFQHPKIVSTQLIIILGRKNVFCYPRIGLIISKKNVKLAHERNRIKRIIRNSFRLYQHNLPIMDFVIIAKKGIANFDNYHIKVVLEKLWHRHCY